LSTAYFGRLLGMGRTKACIVPDQNAVQWRLGSRPQLSPYRGGSGEEAQALVLRQKDVVVVAAATEVQLWVVGAVDEQNVLK
jgi:hypothetical protein